MDIAGLISFQKLVSSASSVPGFELSTLVRETNEVWLTALLDRESSSYKSRLCPRMTEIPESCSTGKLSLEGSFEGVTSTRLADHSQVKCLELLL